MATTATTTIVKVAVAANDQQALCGARRIIRLKLWVEPFDNKTCFCVVVHPPNDEDVAAAARVHPLLPCGCCPSRTKTYHHHHRYGLVRRRSLGPFGIPSASVWRVAWPGPWAPPCCIPLMPPRPCDKPIRHAFPVSGPRSRHSCGALAASALRRQCQPPPPACGPTLPARVRPSP